MSYMKVVAEQVANPGVDIRNVSVVTSANYNAVIAPRFLKQSADNALSLSGISTFYSTDLFEVFYDYNQLSGTGTFGQFKADFNGNVITLSPTSAQTGSVVGPPTSTTNALSVWSDTTGNVLKDSFIIYDENFGGITSNLKLPSYNAASVVFLEFDGSLGSTNGLTWDRSNYFFGINTTTPLVAFHVASGANIISGNMIPLDADMQNSSNSFYVNNDIVYVKTKGSSGNVSSAPVSAMPAVSVISTTKTLSPTDINTTNVCDNVSNITITVPTNATALIPIGSVINFMQANTGQVIITAAGGVTVRSYLSHDRTAGQYAVIAIQKIDTDVWLLMGNGA